MELKQEPVWIKRAKIWPLVWPLIVSPRTPTNVKRLHGVKQKLGPSSLPLLFKILDTSWKHFDQWACFFCSSINCRRRTRTDPSCSFRLTLKVSWETRLWARMCLHMKRDFWWSKCCAFFLEMTRAICWSWKIRIQMDFLSEIAGFSLNHQSSDARWNFVPSPGSSTHFAWSTPSNPKCNDSTKRCQGTKFHCVPAQRSYNAKISFRRCPCRSGNPASVAKCFFANTRIPNSRRNNFHICLEARRQKLHTHLRKDSSVRHD